MRVQVQVRVQVRVQVQVQVQVLTQVSDPLQLWLLRLQQVMQSGFAQLCEQAELPRLPQWTVPRPQQERLWQMCEGTPRTRGVVGLGLGLEGQPPSFSSWFC